MTFLRNTWYMAGWADELDQGGMIARRILDVPVVIYRDPVHGALHALEDRCPHRFAPLSRGEVVPEGIQCGYHGLTFDHGGQCIRNFFAKATPAAARVRSFPVCERPGTVWVWMGDPAQADEGLLPAIRHHEDAGMRYVKGVTTVKADYLLISDNLMDLCHATFLHPAFGGLEYNPRFRAEELADGSIVSDYVVEDIVNIYGPESIPAERIRVRDTIRWVAPSTHLLDSTGGLRDSAEDLVDVPSAHILTPETRFTTHYFWSSGVPVDSPIDDGELYTILKQAFDVEDKPMVEAVRERMGDKELWELDPVLLPTDAGAVRMRRKLASLIAAEGGEG
jgi:nitrite reductase/ring-hydroxylating ferredoxin subunit